MRLGDIELPIVNRGWSQSLAHQRMTVLGTALLDTWAKVADAVPATQKGTVNYLAWLLEALLQVTSQRVPAEFSPATLDAYELRFKQLLGALYSKHFYFGSHTSRNRLATTLMTVRKRLSVQLGAPLTWHLPLDTRRVSPDIQQLPSSDFLWRRPIWSSPAGFSMRTVAYSTESCQPHTSASTFYCAPRNYSLRDTGWPR